MTDSDFVMRDGELLSGVIDKSAIGSTSHGLVHVCYEVSNATTIKAQCRLDSIIVIVT